MPLRQPAAVAATASRVAARRPPSVVGLPERGQRGNRDLVDADAKRALVAGRAFAVSAGPACRIRPQHAVSRGVERCPARHVGARTHGNARRAKRRGDMLHAGVFAHQQARAFEQRAERPQGGAAAQVERGAAHVLPHRSNQRGFVRRAGQHDAEARWAGRGSPRRARSGRLAAGVLGALAPRAGRSESAPRSARPISRRAAPASHKAGRRARAHGTPRCARSARRPAPKELLPLLLAGVGWG